jgi:hypothetical protein
MAEREDEERRLAMEKALRERRWRAAGHIQRFWQGYKVRKVNVKLDFLSIFIMDLFRVSKPRRKRKPKAARKVAKAKNNRIYIIFSFIITKTNK